MSHAVHSDCRCQLALVCGWEKLDCIAPKKLESSRWWPRPTKKLLPPEGCTRSLADHAPFGLWGRRGSGPALKPEISGPSNQRHPRIATTNSSQGPSPTGKPNFHQPGPRTTTNAMAREPWHALCQLRLIVGPFSRISRKYDGAESSWQPHRAYPR
jgi:hypothetical protein